MANKSQIKKFLEKKQSEVLSKLNEESEELQKQAELKFFETYKVQLTEVRNKTIAAATEYDNLVNEIESANLAVFQSRYSCPSYAYNELIGKLSDENLSKYYIDVTESEKIKTKYKKKIEETDREYNNLIALCGANKAVDSIKILENLGFDITEIEVKQEVCTALITNIDTSKLFIK